MKADTPYLHKRPGVRATAAAGAELLSQAVELVGRAEAMLEASGYRAAAHGSHQAKERLMSWRVKVDAAIDRRQAFEAERRKQ